MGPCQGSGESSILSTRSMPLSSSSRIVPSQGIEQSATLCRGTKFMLKYNMTTRQVKKMIYHFCNRFKTPAPKIVVREDAWGVVPENGRYDNVIPSSINLNRLANKNVVIGHYNHRAASKKDCDYKEGEITIYKYGMREQTVRHEYIHYLRHYMQKNWPRWAIELYWTYFSNREERLTQNMTKWSDDGLMLWFTLRKIIGV